MRRDFWTKLKRVIGMVPFAEDLVAAYYCALDPATPMRVRGMLLAALAYFILPFDIIPDMIAGLGFADDAALLTAVVGLVAAHITPTHRAAAARALDKELPPREPRLALRVDDHLAGDLAPLDQRLAPWRSRQGEAAHGYAARSALRLHQSSSWTMLARCCSGLRSTNAVQNTPIDRAALEQDEIQGNARNRARSEAEHEIASLPGHRAQARLGIGAADGVVEHVDALRRRSALSACVLRSSSA